MCIVDTQSILVCASLGCGIVSTRYLVSNIDKVPHPSECSYIGKFYRMSGIHTHDPLDLIIDLHDAVDNLDGGKYYIEIVSGRYTYYTQTIPAKKGKLEIYEKINVHIRQCDDVIVINLYKKHMIKSALTGTLTISVEQEILNNKTPKRRRYTLVHNNESGTRLMLSMYKLSEKISPFDITPLTLQVIMQAQNEGNVLEEDMMKSLEEMSEIQKLRFFSKVISGPLKKMNTFGEMWTEYYFKPLEISPGCWDWCFWESLEKYNRGEECIGSYSFLAISVVVADPSNRKYFYVKYHDVGGEYGILFKKVDRDRDVWTDGLYEFVQRVRDVYFKNPEYRTLKKTKRRIKRCKDLCPDIRYTPDGIDVGKAGLESSTDAADIHTKHHTLTSPLNRTSDKKNIQDHIHEMASNMYRRPYESKIN